MPHALIRTAAEHLEEQLAAPAGDVLSELARLRAALREADRLLDQARAHLAAGAP